MDLLNKAFAAKYPQSYWDKYLEWLLSRVMSYFQRKKSRINEFENRVSKESQIVNADEFLFSWLYLWNQLSKCFPGPSLRHISWHWRWSRHSLVSYCFRHWVVCHEKQGFYVQAYWRSFRSVQPESTFDDESMGWFVYRRIRSQGQ